MRKTIVYIAMSLDGYIATSDNDISFLNTVEKEEEDYGYGEFIQTVDAVIMGRKTYDKVLDLCGGVFPHAADKTCYIITRSPKPSQANLHFYTGDLTALVQKLKSQTGKHIFIDGGAEIVRSLQQLRLIDEYVVSVIPLLLGSGIRLFGGENTASDLRLLSAKSYESGLVQLHYETR